MKTTLYNINFEINELLENSVDYETGEIDEAAFEKLQELELAKEDVIKHASLKYKDVLGEVEKAKNEISRITTYKRQLENLVERIKKYLTDNIPAGEKIKTAEVQIGWRKSESIEVDEFTDFETLFESYPDLIEKKIVFVPKKKEIKEYYKKTGVMPKGFELAEKQNIQIK